MKCNYGQKSNVRFLSSAQQDKLDEYCQQKALEVVNREEAELQETVILMFLKVLYDSPAKYREQRLLSFVGSLRRAYAEVGKLPNQEAVNEWKEAVKKKLFPKFGYPQEFIESLKK